MNTCALTSRWLDTPDEKARRTVISIPEAKDILDQVNPEQADQIQKRAQDYVTKFAKAPADHAKRLRGALVKECGLTDEEATELVNIAPRSIQELRVFTAGWKKLLPTEVVEKILRLLSEVS